MKHSHRLMNKKKIMSTLILICIVFLLYTGAVLQITDNVGLVRALTYAVNMEDISCIKDVNEAIEQKIIEKENAEYNAEAMVLFEAFLGTEAVGLNYVYVYQDYDEDGQIELCLMHKERNKGYVCEYQNGGLQYLHLGDISEIFSTEWKWADIPEGITTVTEMTHLGIYVQVSENEYGEDSFWYVDEASFLKGNGFTDASPYYAYYDENGNAVMVLYYNEQTRHGSGIRYYERDPSTFETTGMYGFTFTGAEKGNWEGTPDYFNLEAVGGGNGEATVEEYQEHYEYDSEGKILHFFSEGLYELFSNEPEETFLIDIEFIYDEQGKLKERYYQHNSFVFGTGYTLWACNFDEFERIEHEYIYVTHGHIENYYIYLDDDNKPEYVLTLDCNMGHWLPEYTEY